jgi:hypothetical protein
MKICTDKEKADSHKSRYINCRASSVRVSFHESSAPDLYCEEVGGGGELSTVLQVAFYLEGLASLV